MQCWHNLLALCVAWPRWVHPSEPLGPKWLMCVGNHDDVIKWKHFARHWPFVRGIYRSPVNFPHKGHFWRGVLMYLLICVWINRWVNDHEAGDLRRHRALYDVTVMYKLRNHFLIQEWVGHTDASLYLWHELCQHCRCPAVLNPQQADCWPIS